jgi:hypothetical protein
VNIPINPLYTIIHKTKDGEIMSSSSNYRFEVVMTFKRNGDYKGLCHSITHSIMEDVIYKDIL